MSLSRKEYGEVSAGDMELGAVGGDVVKVEEELQGRERAPTYSPTSNENSPTVLTFSGITVKTKKNPPKTLIHDVSGTLTGGFWAIMGASGSGKTTLLSVLSLRMDTNIFNISGEMRLNGRDYTKHTLKSMAAFVMQDDLLHAELTVQETLEYAARLRITGEGITQEQKLARVEEVIKLMGIGHCKGTIIGDTRKKGISGGERKRVCVAIELLNRPKLIFLDEPTSGLDSSTALSVCQALKNLADIGECTVVCTIHQPQPKIFDLFDNLLLMRNGEIAFQGGAKKVVNYLAEIGHPLPPNEAVADHLLDVMSEGTQKTEQVRNFGNRKATLTEYIKDFTFGKKTTVDMTYGQEKPTFEDRGSTPWMNQFTVLLQRNLQQYWRRKDQIVLAYLATAILAIFVSCGIWRQIGNNQASVLTRGPSLFFTCVTQGILPSLQSINSFPGERAIMLRERAAGAYHVSAYFMAKSVVDVVTNIGPPILFTCIVYYTIGYQPGAKHFFIYMGFMILNALAALSTAAAVTCTCVSVELSGSVLSCVFEMCRLFGGFFASPAQIKIARMRPWKFADALSYMKYSFVAIALNEMRDLDLVCDPGEKCKYANYDPIIIEKGYDQYTIGFCAGILIVLIFGWRLVAYVGLRFIKV